jgi:hypothetical protein
LTAVSLTLPGNLSREKWSEAGRALGQLQNRTLWYIGDWWAFGDHRYGDRKAIVGADDWEGPEFQTCMDAAWVCCAFETSRRQEVLAFSHHRTVAALPPDLADELLKWCEEPLAAGGRPRSVRRRRRPPKA